MNSGDPPARETSAAPAPHRATPFGLASRLLGHDFFLSFALGPAPRGTHSFASDVARRLRERDFTVFFSEEAAPPGQQLDRTLLRALDRARALVVVVNCGTLQEPRYVRTEVEAFRRRHPGRPVIPINVGGALGDPALAAGAGWLGHEGKIWLDESEAAVAAGIASEPLIERLTLVPKWTRVNAKWRWIVGVVIAALVALAIGLGVASKLAADNARTAEANAEEARASAQRADAAAAAEREAAAVAHERLVAYNVSQGRMALTSGRALEAAPSLLRALKEGADTPAVRFMLARAFASVDARIADLEATALAFAPDGDRLALARPGGAIEVWSVPALQVMATLARPVANVRALTFSPDGTHLAVTADTEEQLEVGDLEEDDCGPGVRARTVEVSQWRIDTGAPLYTVRAPIDPGNACWRAFFADGGAALALAGWTTSRTDLYWSAATFDAETGAPRTVIGSGDQTCDEVAAAQAEDLSACMGKVIALSDDGTALAVAPWGMPQRDVQLWDLQRGRSRTLALGRDTELLAATFSRDGERLALTSADAVEVWDVPGGRRAVAVPLGAGRPAAEFSPDATRLAIVTEERAVAIVDVATGRRVASPAGHTAPIRAITFSPDGERLLTAGDDGTIKTWDGWTGRLQLTLEGHVNPVRAAGFSPDLRYIVSQERADRFRVWDARPPAFSPALRDDPTYVRWGSDAMDLAFAPAGARGGEAEVVLDHGTADGASGVRSRWDVRTGALVGRWRSSEPVTDAAETRPSPCSAASSGGVAPLAIDASGDRELVFEPDTFGRTVSVRSRADGCKPIRLEGHAAMISAAAFDPDGALVLTADAGGAVMVWSAATGERLATATGEPMPLAVKFLSDRRAIGLFDRRVAVVWDVTQERRPVAELQRSLVCTLGREALGDLAPAEATACPPVARGEPSAALVVAARALRVGGWARRQDRAWAERRLAAAGALYRESGDGFGEAVVLLARRALARAAGDAAAAARLAVDWGEVVARLDAAEEQRDRLSRLGELAFDEFGDAELARAAFARVLARAPDDRAARLGSLELALALAQRRTAPEEFDWSTWGTSLRAFAIFWAALRLTPAGRGEELAETASQLWNMYFGATIEAGSERLDFRGLRRSLAAAKIPAAARQQIVGVLETLALPGDHSGALRRLLGVSEDAEIIGP